MACFYTATLAWNPTAVDRLDRCYPDRRPYDFSAGLDARACDFVGIGALWLIFFVNIALVYLTFRKIDPATAAPRTICLGVGLPMLDALERGNLALIAFTCLVLAFGPLVKSARLRWLAAGLAVNFKIYLIAAIVPLVLKRRWRWAEGALLSVVIVYLLSYAAFRDGTLTELAVNIRDFPDRDAPQLLDIWYTTTFQSLMLLLKSNDFPIVLLIGSRNVELISVIVPALQYSVQSVILLAMLTTALRPEVIPSFRLVGLGILMALVTSEAGGYSQIFFTYFVLMEPCRGAGRKWAIIACYILALPLDFIIDTTPPVSSSTYLGGQATFINYYVTVGPFLRPLIIMTIAVALSLVTIREVWADIRHQGWAGRWRFRHDLALLPWVRPPSPPVAR